MPVTSAIGELRKPSGVIGGKEPNNIAAIVNGGKGGHFHKSKLTDASEALGVLNDFNNQHNSTLNSQTLDKSKSMSRIDPAALLVRDSILGNMRGPSMFVRVKESHVNNAEDIGGGSVFDQVAPIAANQANPNNQLASHVNATKGQIHRITSV